MNMDASGHKTGGGAGSGELDTEGGKAPTLTVTAHSPNPRRKTTEPQVVDTVNRAFLTEIARVSDLFVYDSAMTCPPGTYYFYVVFKIKN